MKKLIYAMILVVPVLAFTNCNNKNKVKNTPSQAARQYADNIRTGNYDVVYDCMFIVDDNERTAWKNDRTKHTNMVRNNVDKHVQRHGGIKKVDVVSEKVNNDGKTANVVLRQDYNNGHSENIAYDMMLVDNDWKVKVGPHKEVWKTQLADGTNVGFKLKDYDEKEVYKQHIGDERDFIKIKDGENKDVIKVKDDGDKDVLKIKEKDDEIVIKEKHNGEKEVTRIPKE